MSYPDAPMFPPFPPTQISNGSNRYPLPQSVPPTGESDAQPPFIISGNESDIQEVRADSQGLGSEAKARLRKACDSCSIRKVKVCPCTSVNRTLQADLMAWLSVMRMDHLAGLALV